jgi:Ca2+-binding RTX toxin-like protein
VTQAEQTLDQVVVNLAPLSKNSVNSKHFGGNYGLDRASTFNEIGEHGNFDEATSSLGINFLRYPGGEETERLFHLSDPNFENADEETKNMVTSMATFLSEAEVTSADVSFVLPTFDYYAAILGGTPSELSQAESEVKNFISNLMEGDYAHLIKMFEIGNEFWAYNEMGGKWARDTDINEVHQNYGRVASKMAEWIQAALETTSNDFDPIISVQTSVRSQFLNDLIMDEFSQSAFEAIDGVVTHLYSDVPWTQNQVRLDAKTSLVESWKANSGKDLSYLITEWNVRSWEGVDGMLQAAGILDMFTAMLRSGVDATVIWPITQTTQNALTFSIESEDEIGATQLKPAGIAYKMLAESTLGLRPVELDSELSFIDDGTTEEGVYEVTTRGDYTSGNLLEFGDADALLQIYSDFGGETVVGFFSSLESEDMNFDLDLSAYEISQSYDHLWGSKLVVSGGSPLRPWTEANVQSLVTKDLEGNFLRDGVISLDLQPFEIIRLEFTIGRGVNLTADSFSDQNDSMEGSRFDDIIRSFGGDDTVIGREGNDTLYGGDGNDIIYGGNEEDKFLPSRCDFFPRFRTTTDNIPIESDADELFGEDGNDILFGGTGTDVLNGGSGDDELWGGLNSDVFVFVEFSGNDTIHDFDANNSSEKIDFTEHNAINSMNDVEENSSQVGADVILRTDINSQIILRNVMLGDLDNSDFLF